MFKVPTSSCNLQGRYACQRSVASFLFFIVFFFSILQVHSQTLPAGFSQVLVANGISSPTVMAFAPDGRIFVAQQNGQLRIIKNGSLLAKPFIALPVNASGERGLLGIAFDPAFNTNKYIYLYYTLSSAVYNRISRFTAGSGANPDTVMPNSEVVILNLDTLSSATNHNGGTMQFGLDGKLYVGVGENANSNHAQNLDTYHGKILRINSDGTIPPGNPYTTGSVKKQRVWEHGMRNPFTLVIQPGTGKIFVNDVGAGSWEEINDCTIGGKNYGWPSAEGMNSNPAYVNPVYAYPHGSGIGRGCAITGGTFFNPSSTNYPPKYIGRYFFLDLCNDWIDMLTFNGSNVTDSNFASNIAGDALGIVTGPDGNLYFLSRANSAVYKITYTISGGPVITQHPQSITVAQGNSASFSVTATGAAPLNYQWRKGTTNIGGANASTYTIPSVVTADAGTYSVIVSNTSGIVTSNGATLTVTSPNQPPNAIINTPAAGATYAGGNTINFSGSATDPNQTIPASGFEWYVLFYHDTHNHPGPTAPDGVMSGSFTIPTSGETATNVFYRLFLVATDAQGAKDTAFTDILPRTSTITLNTNPQGLQVTLDGQPFTASYTAASVEGIIRTIGVVSPQTVNSVTYTFSSWTHGGTQSQTIATPVNDVSYTANFTASSLRNPENPASTVNGVDYSYYLGNWSMLPNFATLTPVSSGNAANFDLSARTQNDNFAFHFTGYISVPADGIYTFYTSSDDGSKLYIGTTTVVNNDATHSNRERSGQIGLKAGKHSITVDFFERTGQQVLTVSYAGPNIAKQAVPDAVLYRVGTPPPANTVVLVADAYVNSGGSANTNFGANTVLLCKKTNATELQREVYLRFDISSFSPAISSAKLRVYGNLNTTDNPSVPVEVHNVTDITWGENTITWNNKPAAQAAILATTTIAGTAKKYYEWDITQHIIALRNAGVNLVSLKLMNTNSTSARVEFNSKEAAANRPQLVIVPASAKTDNEIVPAENTVENPVPSVKIYPNPALDYFNIEIAGAGNNNVLQLFDLNGRLVKETRLADNSIQNISIADLESGMYVIHIRNEAGEIFARKILVER